MKAAAGFLLALSVSFGAASAISAPWQSEIIAEGLDYPWDIATDGTQIFMTEKAGNVLTLRAGAISRAAIQTSIPIETDGGRGLLGMALAPDFATTGRAFFYQSTATGNRVIEAMQQGEIWRETRIILDGIPGHRLYNGGRIAFGPDGMLYITTGWTEDRARPQDLDSLAGKILRIAEDGSIPADNPFPGSPVWSLGHRNPQGLVWDDQGRLFAAEHGQAAHDEINLIEKGANYGWPVVQGDEHQAGMTAPFLHSGGATWAPSGIAVHDGQLLVAALAGQSVLAVQDGAVTPFFDLGERVRDIESLNGDLYVITTNRSPRGSGPSDDRLIRLSR